MTTCTGYPEQTGGCLVNQSFKIHHVYIALEEKVHFLLTADLILVGIGSFVLATA